MPPLILVTSLVTSSCWRTGNCRVFPDADAKLAEYIITLDFPDVLNEPLTIDYDFDPNHEYFTDIGINIDVAFSYPQDAVTIVKSYDEMSVLISPGEVDTDTKIYLVVYLYGDVPLTLYSRRSNIKRTPPCLPPSATRYVQILIPASV